jgi:hypothetical protein
MNMNRTLLGGGIAAGLVLVSCGALPDSGILALEKFGLWDSGARMKLSGRRAPLSVKAAPEIQAAQAVLLRQERRQGIPGFGDNAFSAISGDYGLETPGQDREEAGFSVWISSMDMYYEAWTRISPIAGCETRTRESEGRRLVTLAFDIPRGFWTAVFSFPQEEGTTLTGAEQNRIIETFAARFVYFLSFSRTRNDVSLPAVLVY